MILVGLLLLAVLALVLALAVGSLRAPRGSIARRSMAVGAVVIAALVAVSAWAVANPRMQPLEPDAPVVMGVRADADDLSVWIGERCEDVDTLKIGISVREPRRSVELRLEAEEPTTLAGPLRVRELQEDPPEPFAVVERWPDGVDLAAFDAVSVLAPGGGAQASMEEVLAGSADRPGEFWFGEDLGWMSAQEAAQRDGEDFYALCATDVQYE